MGRGKLGTEAEAEDESGGRGENGGIGRSAGSGATERVATRGNVQEVEIEAIRKMLARATHTGHTCWHNA
jgi:hypothetical protein